MSKIENTSSESVQNQADMGVGLTEDASPETEQSNAPEPKAKKAKTEKSEKSKQKEPSQQGKTPGKSTKPPQKAQDQETVPPQPRMKRGPARPHRRLAMEVIDTRITKLQKRLDRTRSQYDDAARHVEGYIRERDIRAKEV